MIIKGSAVLFSDQLEDRYDQPADRVAERDNDDIQQCLCAPCVGDGEIVHICYAVLESAEDEDHDAEYEGQVFAELVRIVLESVYSDVDADVTEEGRYPQAWCWPLSLRVPSAPVRSG